VGDFFQQVGFAFKCFFLVLFAGRLPHPIPPRFLEGRRVAASGSEADAAPSPALERQAARADEEQLQLDRAVQLLALLQRDGRLVDFLFEDIDAYPDDQVGAAVREVHASSREVLRRYVTVEPVIPGEEGRPALVEPGFDPGAVKLVGLVTGQPPFRGILRHRGWRVTGVQLPALPDGGNRQVVAPAEVEIG
jgi:hypothetical protein